MKTAGFPAKQDLQDSYRGGWKSSNWHFDVENRVQLKIMLPAQISMSCPVMVYQSRRERERERQRQRQRQRQRHRQTDRQTETETDRDRETQTDRQIDRRETDRQTNKRETDRQREADRQTGIDISSGCAFVCQCSCACACVCVWVSVCMCVYFGASVTCTSIFFLQGQLFVLTPISVSVPPPCYRSST